MNRFAHTCTRCDESILGENYGALMLALNAHACSRAIGGRPLPTAAQLMEPGAPRDIAVPDLADPILGKTVVGVARSPSGRIGLLVGGRTGEHVVWMGGDVLGGFWLTTVALAEDGSPA